MKKTEEEKRAGIYKYLYGVVLKRFNKDQQEAIINISLFRMGYDSKTDIPIDKLMNFIEDIEEVKRIVKRLKNE